MIRILKFEKRNSNVSDTAFIESAYEIAEKTGCKMLKFKSIGIYNRKIFIFSDKQSFIDFVRFFIKDCEVGIEKINY